MFEWETFFEIIVAYAIAALVIERALYQVFDTKLWKWVEEKVNEAAGGDHADLKPWISVVVSVGVALKLDLDICAFMFGRAPNPLTVLLTGLFIAGGSTGVYKFFKRARKLKEARKKAAIVEAKRTE